MATNLDLIRRLELHAEVEGAAKAVSDMRALVGSFEEMKRVAERAAEGLNKGGDSATSMSAKVDRMLKRLMPGYREMQQFERGVKDLTDAMAQGHRFGGKFPEIWENLLKTLPQVRAEMAKTKAEAEKLNDVRMGSLAERIRKDTELVERAMADRQRVIEARRKRDLEVQEKQFYREYRTERGERFGLRTSEVLATRTDARFRETREGSAAERLRRETKLIDDAMAERNRQIEKRQREAEQIMQRSQERQFYREYRTERTDRFGSRGGEVRSARAEVGRRRGEAELGSYLNERFQQADPLAAGQKRFEEAQERVNRARKLGLRDEKELAAILEYERKVMRDIERDFGAGKGGFRQNQRANLTYQAYDIGQGIISGQPLAMIGAQQLPQIAQIVGDHPGGMKAGIKALMGPFAALGVVGVGTFAAITAGAIAGAAAVYSYASSIGELERQLAGAGRRSGMSAGSVAAGANRIAGGANLSVSEARGAMGTFGATGRIGQGMSEQLTGSLRDFAKTVGQDAETATQTLATMFAAPGRGAEEFAEKLGGSLGPEVIRQIQLMERMGDRLGAQQMLLDRIRPTLESHREGMSGLARIYDVTSNAVSNFFNAIGEWGASKLNLDPVERQLERVQERLAAARGRQGTPLNIFGAADRDVQRLKDLEAALAAIVRRRKEAGMDADDAARTRELSAAINSAIPDIESKRAVEARALTMRSAANNTPAVTTGLGVQEFKRREEAAQRAEGANATWISSEQRLAEQHKITVAAISASTVAEEAAAAAAQKLLDLKGKEATAVERLAAALNVQKEAYARNTKEATDAARAAEANLKVAGLLPAQAARQQLANEEAEKRRRAGNNADAQAGIDREFAARRAQMGIEQGFVPGRDYSMRIREAQAANEGLAKSLFATEEATATAAARQELINEAFRNGQTAAERYGAQWESLAAQMGKAVTAGNELRHTQQNIVGGMDEIRQASSSAGTGLFSALRQGQDGMKALENASGRLADQMFERLAMAPLTNSLLGRPGTNGQDSLLGGFLAPIFGWGQQQTTGTMTVTAGVVNIAGAGAGVGSLIPGVGGAAGATGTSAAASAPAGAAALAGTTGGALVTPFSARTVVQGGGAVLSAGPSGGGVVVAGDGSVIPIPPIRPNFSTSGAVLPPIRPVTSAPLPPPPLTGDPVYDLYRRDPAGPGDSGWAPAPPVPPVSRFYNGSSTPPVSMGWAPGARLTTDQQLGNLGYYGGAKDISWYGDNTPKIDTQVVEKLAPAMDKAATAASTAATEVTSLGGGAADATNALSSLPNALSGLLKGGGGISVPGLNLGGGSGSSASAAGAGADGFGLNFADGGRIWGAGHARSDSIWARVSPGEYIVNAAATARHHDTLHAINNGAPRFADGGPYLPPGAMMAAESASAPPPSRGDSGPRINVNNFNGSKVEVEEKEDEFGNRRTDINILDEMTSSVVGRTGSRSAKAVRRMARPPLKSY